MFLSCNKASMYDQHAGTGPEMEGGGMKCEHRRRQTNAGECLRVRVIYQALAERRRRSWFGRAAAAERDIKR